MALKPAPGENMVTFSNLKMNCNGCRTKIEKKLNQVSAASQIYVDLPTKSATVVFDPNKVTLDELRTALGQQGYTEELVQG